MSIALKKKPGGAVPTPPSTHLTFFVDQSGNPSLKDSTGAITPATNAGGPALFNEQGSTPALAPNAVKVYAKDVDSTSQLFALNDAGEETQITGGVEPSAINVRWNGGVEGNLFDATSTVPTHADVVQTLIDPTTTLSGEGEKEGVKVEAGDRVLRACAYSPPDEADEDQVANGIYIVASGDWTRATDADTGAEIQDAIVEMEIDPDEPSYAMRWALWNPTGIPLNVGVDPQNWVLTVYYGSFDPFLHVAAVAVTNIALSDTTTEIDGYSLNPGDLILAAGQTDPINNGVYIVGTGDWLRDTVDMGIALSGGTILYVDNGGVYADYQFFLNYPFYGLCVVGVDPQEWLLFQAVDLAQSGPVRVDVDFDDMVMARSTIPYNFQRTNSLVILTLPPITEDSAGKAITYVSHGFLVGKMAATEIPAVYVQPAGTDAIIGMAPGELGAIILFDLDDYGATSMIGHAFDLISDGYGSWIIKGQIQQTTYALLSPVPATP